ncbi:MAG: reverse transcriptase domain-containing protein [Pseudomonadota bacterium]
MTEEERVDKGGVGGREEWKKLRKGHLRVLQWNADGLTGKKAELEDFLRRWDVDVAVIQETKLGNKTKTPVIQGYTAVRKDRVVVRRGEEMKGGGLLTYIKREIPFRRLQGWKGGTTEGLSVVVDCDRRDRLTITNVYRPPLRRIRGEDERRHTKVRQWLKRRANEMVLGDFNLHSGRWGGDEDQGRDGREEAEEVVRWCEENGYGILNNGRKTCLDRRTGRMSAPDVSLAEEEVLSRCTWRVEEELSSDHLPILIDVQGAREGRRERKILSWAWRRANWEEYCKEMEERAEQLSMEGSLKERVIRWTEVMLETASKWIPKKKVSRRNRPFWDEELDELRKERDRLRGDAQKREEWREKCGELKERLKEKKRLFWRSFVEGLREGEEKKVWKTIKSLSTGSKGEAPNEIICVGGREARTDRQKANAFMTQYADTSRVKTGKEERGRRVEVMNRLGQYAKDEEEFGAPFTQDELEGALEHLEEGKKGGADGVEAAMMKRLGEKAKERWLQIFNLSWNEGRCLGRWKQAVIIPILKSGKDPKDMGSYRPVSLTSVCVKIMERMVVNRLYYWMERTGVVKGWQAGFQRGRGTEEQVVRMVQEIQDGFERRGGHEKTVLVTLDCTKAFDKVWRVRMVERMMDEGVPGPVVRWLSSFLEGRKACVRIGTTMGTWRVLKEGLPQGAVSSPALFLLYVNDWREYEETGVNYSGFADDLALWCTGRRVEELQLRMQRALTKVEVWARHNKIELNPQKSESCLFTRDARERKRELGLMIGGRRISTNKEVLFLGVAVDQGLTFGGQVARVVGKVKKRVRVLWAVAGQDWGWGRKEMVRIYKAVVESCIWYGCSAWIPWLSLSNLEKLERAQREGLQSVTGLTSTSPKECFYLEAEVAPVRVEAKRRAVLFFEKACRAREDDPKRELSERQVQRRLAANKGWREQARQESERLGLGDRMMGSWQRQEPWRGLGENVVLRDSMVEAVRREDSDERKKEVFRMTMQDVGEDEMVVFTDGSVEDGVRNGGAACYARWRGETVIRRRAVGRWSSSFAAETVAMREGVEAIAEAQPNKATICTDSQALVRRLRSRRVGSDREVENLRLRLQEVAEGRRITIQWVPGHVGIDGNEEVDRQAKEARNEQQDGVPIGLQAAKRRIYREISYRPRLEGRLEEVYRSLQRKENAPRREQVLMAQLRAGHCPKTAYYQKRIGLREEAVCRRCGAEEVKDHWLECAGVEGVWQECYRDPERAGNNCKNSVNISTPDCMFPFVVGHLGDENLMGRFLRRAYPEWLA